MALGAVGVTPSVGAFTGGADEWDRAVRSHPGWTHYHLFGWQGILQNVLGHECAYLADVGPGGEQLGVLPLVHVRSVLFGHYLMSMPFLNYGGPLGPADSVGRLVSRALDMARSTRTRMLELRSGNALPIDLPVSHRKITVLLDLPEGDADPLWRKLGSKLRSQIKRPRKAGVEIETGLDQVDPFYRVFARHMRDLGTPALPRSFFRAIAETFPGDVRFTCAYYHGQPIAAGAGFRWGDQFELAWASALVEHKKLAANMLLYWSLMEQAVAEGVSLFNFGRCTPGSGTHRFKLQWGGREEDLWWYHHPADRATPSPTDGKYAWGPKIWSRLPVWAATALGPRIVRGIP